MFSLPDDADRYEPTPEDWAEYCEWRRRTERTECCPAHNWQIPDVPCPDCEEEQAATWAAGEEPEGLWYLDLLLQASHGQYDPHCGWRAEQ
jgi:hypothetical protein